MRYLWLLMTVLLPACQLGPVADETSPLYLVPAGSWLLLKQPLTIPGGSTGIRLQGGQVRDPKDINEWHPNCRLEVRTLSDAARTVGPGRFEVTRVRREVAVAAGSREGYLRRVSENGAPTYFVFRTTLDLRSTLQPDVAWLTCQQWGEPALGRDLSIREIRVALGDIITLELPAPR
jgi:hypothetical protein